MLAYCPPLQDVMYPVWLLHSFTARKFSIRRYVKVAKILKGDRTRKTSSWSVLGPENTTSVSTRTYTCTLIKGAPLREYTGLAVLGTMTGMILMRSITQQFLLFEDNCVTLKLIGCVAHIDSHEIYDTYREEVKVNKPHWVNFGRTYRLVSLFSLMWCLKKTHFVDGWHSWFWIVWAGLQRC